MLCKTVLIVNLTRIQLESKLSWSIVEPSLLFHEEIPVFHKA